MNFIENKRRVCSLALALVISTTGVVRANASLKEAENKKNNISAQMQDTKSQINNIKGEANVVEAEIARLDREINQANNHLISLNNEIDQLNIEIEKTKEELRIAHENLKEKQDIFAKRLRVMYINGDVGYLEVLLNSEDIETLLTNSEMISAIAQQDRELITYIKEQIDTIHDKTMKLESQMNELEGKKNEVAFKKASLESANAAKNQYMSTLQSNIAEYEVEYDRLLETSNQIEKEINRIKKDIEEQKRIAAEKARIAKEKAEQARKSSSTTASSIKYKVSTSRRSGSSMTWPVPGNSRISSYYGYRLHPVLGYQKFHSGVDIPAASGTPVVAAAEGVVIVSTTMGGYGNVVMVDHGNTVTVYAHNSVLKCRVGDVVSAGETIALVGSTGLSTGPHLHFEVRIGGQTVDPLGHI